MSCDGNTDAVFEVENRTSDTLIFNWVSIRYDTLIVEAERVLPGSTQLVLFESTRGGRKNVPAISEYLGDPFLTSASGDTSVLNLVDPGIWEITSTERRKLPSDWEHRYRLVVNTDHFEE